jgi:iron complex transport system substrate-binding protein
MKELIKGKFGLIFSFFIGFLPVSCSYNENIGLEIKDFDDLCSKSKNLSIEQKNDGYLVTTRYTIDPNVDPIENKFFLGTTKPKRLSGKIVFIKTPIKRGVFLSSSHVGMMYELGLEKVICGISGKQFLCEKTKNLNQLEEFMDLSGQGIERLISTHTSLVMYSGFDSKPALIEKLEKINIPCIPNYDWREETPLGRAEWIKLFGILNGKEVEAANLFTEICSNYNTLKAQTLKIGIAQEEAVLWLNYLKMLEQITV